MYSSAFYFISALDYRTCALNNSLKEHLNNSINFKLENEYPRNKGMYQFNFYTEAKLAPGIGLLASGTYSHHTSGLHWGWSSGANCTCRRAIFDSRGHFVRFMRIHQNGITLFLLLWPSPKTSASGRRMAQYKDTTSNISHYTQNKGSWKLPTRKYWKTGK